MHVRNPLSGFALALLLASPAVADDDVRLEQIPDAARATIERETRGGVIEDIERKVRPDGTVYFEVEWERGDQDWELHVGADGKLLKRARDD